MASRSIAGELVRFLHGLTAPVCLFDEDRRLVFANQACADWAAVSLDELIGRTASYTSAAKNDGSAAVDRLCPPPEAFAGGRQSGVIHAVSPDGQLRRRRADFQPLDRGADGSSSPVLVLADASDITSADPGPLDAAPLPVGIDDAQLLHDRLMRFQHGQSARYRLDRLIGDSPAMQLARSQARAAIASGASVIVVGPPGGGREQVARTIHYATVEVARKERPDERGPTLLPLDGSLLTGEVLASAIHALSAQRRAAAATLLVLHVDRLTLDIQAEMVRVFVQRFEGVRFLATSEISPDVLVLQGRLHPLLAAAVSTLVIQLPPLADRREDIPLIAQLAVEELNAERKKQVRGFAAEAIDAMVAYSWPGNVAELRGFVGEAFARAEGAEITVADLPRRLSYAAGMARRPARVDEPIVLAEFMTSIERELIERALKQSKGNRARAARLLGLTRPRLYRRMVQLGLEEATQQSASFQPKRRGADGAPRRKAQRDADHDKKLEISAESEDETNSEEVVDFIEDIPFEEQAE